MPPNRILAAWTAAGGEITVLFDFKDSKTHRVSLYFFDLGNQGRKQTVDMLDPSNLPTPLAPTQSLNNLKTSVYQKWSMTGKVQMRVTLLLGTGPTPS